MPHSKLTITTVLKSNSFYNHTWVEKMKRGLERHMTMPFNFLPLSDCNHSFPTHKFVDEQPGYWNKIELFRPGLYTGPTLFIDADNVITGDLSPMITALQGHKFVMYKSRVTLKHPKPTPSSCVMYWEGDHSYIWNVWKTKDQQHWFKEYKVSRGTGRKGDQGFIREHANNLELIHDLYPNAYNEIKFVQGEEPDLSKVNMLVFAGGNKPHNTSWKNIISKEWI